MPRARISSARRQFCIAAVLGIAGMGTGAAGRALRPLTDWGGLHFDALGSLALLLLGSLALGIYHRRQFRGPAALWLQVDLAACWWFFVLGWTVVHGRVWTDVITVFGLWWAGTASVLGLGLLAFQTAFPVTPDPAPHCPGCGYCLIGLPTLRCPECGRPFTLEELNLTAADLRP